LEAFLKNKYIEKRTLDYHATQLFNARQSKTEIVSDLMQKIQRLGSEFIEAALQDCEPEERVGILTITDSLRNIYFV